MKKRYIPITITVIVLAFIAFVGYLRPETRPTVPVRILFDNGSNRVVFSHLLHNRAGKVQCLECHHHNEGNESDPIACELCHPAAFDENYVQNHPEYFQNQTACLQCHHMEFGVIAFDHEAHTESAGDCIDCHHGPDKEPESQSCRSCHPTGSDKNIPRLQDAAHDRCQQCHDEKFEEGPTGCFFCHSEKDLKASEPSYPDCRKCHPAEDSKDLIPETTAAFHRRCMNCHRQNAKGPCKEDECFRCHFR